MTVTKKRVWDGCWSHGLSCCWELSDWLKVVAYVWWARQFTVSLCRELWIEQLAVHTFMSENGVGWLSHMWDSQYLCWDPLVWLALLDLQKPKQRLQIRRGKKLVLWGLGQPNLIQKAFVCALLWKRLKAEQNLREDLFSVWGRGAWPWIHQSGPLVNPWNRTLSKISCHQGFAVPLPCEVLHVLGAYIAHCRDCMGTRYYTEFHTLSRQNVLLRHTYLNKFVHLIIITFGHAGDTQKALPDKTHLISAESVTHLMCPNGKVWNPDVSVVTICLVVWRGTTPPRWGSNFCHGFKQKN